MADVDAIVEDLTSTGVHLGPGTQTWLSDKQLEAFEQAVRAGDLPVHLVLVQPAEDGITAGDDLLVRVHDAGGPEGLYIGVNNVWDLDGPAYHATLPDDRQVNVALQQWGPVQGNTDVVRDVDAVLSGGGTDGRPPTLGDGLVTVAEALASGDLAAVADEARDAQQAAREADAADGNGQSGGTTGTTTPYADENDTGDAVLGGVILLTLLLGAVLGTRALVRRLRDRASTRAFTLPDSVLDRVREAGDADLARRARAAVLALGERIDAADLDGSDAAAWTATLDHYDAAGRLLPDDPTADMDPLDAVGAVVLAGRGEEALAAARRGRTFTPSTRCFLNPLHGRATRDHALEHASRRVDAPICATCRRDLEAGRRPDILDVVVRGRPEHYFETDREPWASTGFGALEPDLVRRLHRGGRR
ncbi:hypothetical protein [Nocardioides deserti]|uniref:Uncharacterized protein n=1 Tax=Nocardioides deserti TaxID=1588644 RepID=A0ABR6U951_9ACTN|nr:hypothetical protein [Nocardioides deserti]MBC2960979.1 hypothetical protein [Nocardioides deserti]GGO75997.1 hypothetical protein GCM10012276_27710 [Nocardioides deserti]